MLSEIQRSWYFVPNTTAASRKKKKKRTRFPERRLFPTPNSRIPNPRSDCPTRYQHAPQPIAARAVDRDRELESVGCCDVEMPLFFLFLSFWRSRVGCWCGLVPRASGVAASRPITRPPTFLGAIVAVCMTYCCVWLAGVVGYLVLPFIQTCFSEHFQANNEIHSSVCQASSP